MGGRVIRSIFRTRGGAVTWTVMLLLAAASLTPSLMPRSAVFQGVVTAVVMWAGWLVCNLLATAFGGLISWNLTPWVRRWAGLLLVAAAGAAVGVMCWRWLASQRQVHRLFEVEPPGAWSRLVVLLVAIGLLLVLLVVSAAIRSVGGLLGHPLRRMVNVRIATTVGCLVVVLLVGAAADRWLVRDALAAIDSSFDALNNGTPPGATQPTSALRSGGPGSGSPWEELGEQGRGFVSSGPSAETLTEVTGSAAAEPIRVYAGLDSGEDLTALAELAVSELERTDAFERQVLAVAVPTGRGWINDDAISALEYLYAGETATVGIQYSYLPSPMAFLVDPERAKEAGQALFEAVYARWSELPESERPQLVVYGESLGSTGVQAAFSGLPDLRARTDGALFVGPPESNTLWRDLVDRRDPGSPEVLPVYDAGRNARFASRPEELDLPGAWERARAVFLQNPSDPIVWWSPSLLFQEPDWLDEPRGHDVSARMRWYPMVTFLQVTADMAVGNDVPAGHGHRYRDFVDYWTAILPPPG